MNITVLGTVNLAPKKRIQVIQPSVNFPDRWIAVEARPNDVHGNPVPNGYVEINDQGIIGVGDPVEGAWQVCRKVEQQPGMGLLVYQYGILAYSENELF